MLDPHGVVGQIVQADPPTATAISVTDVSPGLPIEISRTGVRTLALGTGNFQELKLPHIPNNGDVKVGDALVTSGLGGRFPRGYRVGTVTKVEFDPGSPFANITAKPFAQLDRIREVMLLENESPGMEPATAAAPSGPRPP